MCRLFGLKSVVSTGLHASLIEAENALSAQSKRHPDGWGVAYYIDRYPHLIKSIKKAEEDKLFHEISDNLSAKIVLAHIRQATFGKVGLFNCHPFQFGPWVFAHNGDMPNFIADKGKLLTLISSDLHKYYFGMTDSELFFYVFLTELGRKQNILEICSVRAVIEALKASISKILDVTAPSAEKVVGLTCVVSDGDKMIGVKRGPPLNYSIHKKSCSLTDTCEYYRSSCLKSLPGSKLTHFLLSSENVGVENVWESLDENQIVGVDSRMRLFLDSLP